VVAVLVTAAVLVVGLRLAPRAIAPARDPSGTPVAPHLLLRRVAWRSSRRPPDDVAVAAWCERVAAGVRSGSSLTRAVIDADVPSRGSAPFPDVVHAIRRGRPLAATFREATGDPSTPTGLTAPVLTACAELGGPPAGPLERVASVLLARAAERAERRAASAQARLSCRVLTVVPLGVLVFLVLTEPAVRTALTTPAGMACLVAGAALDGLGWWWMRHLIGAAS
jgi:tight adherence protein B